MNTIKRKIIGFISHPLATGSFVILVGSMGANAGAYLYHVLIGRLLGPVIYGEFAALMSLFYLINIGSGVVQTVLTKFFSQLRAQKLDHEIPTLFRNAFWIITIFTLIGLVLIQVFSGALSAFLHISSANFVWLYLIFVTYVYTIINISLIQSFQFFVASSVLTNIGTVLRIVFGVLGAPLGLIGVLVGNIISNVITYGMYFVPVWRLIRVKASPLSITKSDTISYSLPTVLVSFGTIALYSQDVLLVKHFFSPHEAGIYASLAVLGKVIFYASSSLGYVMFPLIAERKELNRPHHMMVFAALGSVAALSCALTLSYFMFPLQIVQFMYGKAFDGAVPYMGLFGLFITFFSLVNMLTTACLAIGKTRIWIISISTAAIQSLGILAFHASLYQVIFINIGVTCIACLLLLLYYFHVKD